MGGSEKLKLELNHLYEKYHRAELLGEDPLGLVSAKASPADFEIVSYVSASLAYGRVEQIRKSLQALWIRLGKLGVSAGGEGIHQFFVDNSGKTLQKDFRKLLKGWVHRFNNDEDVTVLFKTLQSAVKERGSLGEIYASTPTEHPTEKLQAFIEQLRAHASDKDLEQLRWFACAPSEGSTCKRMVMWLRWMLRSDEIDPGLWSKNEKLKKLGVGAHLAFIPMDTHIHRFAMERNLLSTKNPTWKSVEEFSAILRKIDPLDPARFDFCICHYGMMKFRNKKNEIRV